MKFVRILRGVPGSGKSTYVASMGHSATTAARVVSADHHFMVDGAYKFDARKLPEAHQACWRSFYAALNERDIDVIYVDNTNISAAEIGPYVLPAESCGWQVEIITLECDPVVAAARNVHGVPAESVHRMHARLQAAEKDFPPFWRHRKVSTAK